MAIDKSQVESIIGPFRGMMKDVEDKGIKGEAADKMRSLLATMERLGREMDDLAAYSTKLATDNIYVDFGNWYSRALSAHAQAQAKASPMDDAAMLKNTVTQYEGSYNRLKDDPRSRHLAGPLKRIVELGKSGVSYPVFLRRCEEQGLWEMVRSGDNRALLEWEIDNYEKLSYPVEAEMFRKLQGIYLDLAKRSAFGTVDPVEYEMREARVRIEYAPRIALWRGVIEHWSRLMDMVYDWLDSFCSFAPRDQRWADPLDPAKTKINIARTQECQPGMLKVREAIFKEYYGLSWDDFWSHETYLNEQKAVRIWYSDESIALIREARKACLPGGKPGSDLVKREETIHAGKRWQSPAFRARWGEGKVNPYGFTDFSEFVSRYAEKK